MTVVLRRKKYDADPKLKDLSFNDLISWCCIADEIILRKAIKKNLAACNFSFIEDDYKSYRSLNDEDNVHLVNLLLTRGDAKYCLVAHTDVCRDHSAVKNNSNKKFPNPIIKNINGRNVLQDSSCKVQLGGDDRLGVAIALWIALHTETPVGLLFTTDEEIGLESAGVVKFPELNNFELLIQIDRGNYTNQLVNKIRDVQLCDDQMLQSLLEKLSRSGFKRDVVAGYGTDVFIIKKNNMCKNAINMTCGYHESKSDSGDEYIDLLEAEEALNTVICFLDDQMTSQQYQSKDSLLF